MYKYEYPKGESRELLAFDTAVYQGVLVCGYFVRRSLSVER